MGCCSSKTKEDDSLEFDDLGGTVIVAFSVVYGLIVAFDSRSSNEKNQDKVRRRPWQLIIVDDADKLVKDISTAGALNVIAVKAGIARTCDDMWNTVRQNKNNYTQVSQVNDNVKTFLEGLRGKERKCGTIIAGWDAVNIYRAYIEDDSPIDTIVNDEHIHNPTVSTSLGSGAQYAQQIYNAGSRYQHDMTVDEAANLALESIFYATLYDRLSGGELKVYHVTTDSYAQLRTIGALQANLDFYNSSDSEKTLFLVVDCQLTGSDLKDTFRHMYQTEVIKAAHRVAHCGAKDPNDNASFYFHRLIFEEQSGAQLVYNSIANSQLADPDPNAANCLKIFDYKVNLNVTAGNNKGPVSAYVSWSTRDLLLAIISDFNELPG